MSVNKWAYDPRKCDGEPCVGDCDMCSKKDEYLAPVYGCVGCKWKGSACKGCARHYPDRFEWKGGK